MRFCVLSVLCFVGLSVLGGTFGFADNRRAITDFDARFREVMAEEKVPGGAFAIVENGRISVLGTYGKRSLGSVSPVTEKTVFRLASVSKTFTAELAALLVEEGKLSWDDRVVDAVPDFSLKTPRDAEQLRVKHLLSHSAGLAPNAYDLMLEDGWPLAKIIPHFKELKPRCRPGECYAYQNVLFSLIQPMIEKSTGKSFESLMESHIFRPLGLETASIGLAPFKAAENHADPHRRVKKRWVKTSVNGDYYTVAPAAGVNASVLDLAKWVRAQMGYNKDVLDQTVLDTVTEKRVKTRRELYRAGWKHKLSDAYYGYGWRIYEIGGKDIILHAGGVAGFRSLVAYSREFGVGLVMLMNAETRSINTLGAEFWAGLVGRKGPG